jgi:hypothetical protein
MKAECMQDAYGKNRARENPKYLLSGKMEKHLGMIQFRNFLCRHAKHITKLIISF